MEERRDEAGAFDEQPTVRARQLRAGDLAPDFRLDYLDLADLVVRTICLADSSGQVLLLGVVNSLAAPFCHQVIKQWETLRVRLPPDACLYTVSMDPPQEQARWQETEGVLHQVLSAQRGEQFGRDYGVWLNEGRQLAQAVFVLDRADRIAYAEYVADPLREPDYAAALQAVLQAALA
jgi:thioredoxin-dependent peroxiredoxin